MGRHKGGILEPPTRAAVYIAYWEEGQSAAALARRYGVGEETLSRWLGDYGIPVRSISEAAEVRLQQNPHPRGENCYSRIRRGRREDLGGRYFRSAWEANWARYLNLLVSQGHVSRWEYEAETFRFEGVTRGPYTYRPDFKVFYPDGSVVFMEVKGWMDSASRTRLKRMAKYYPEINIEVIDASRYREIRKLSSVIAGWEGG